MAKQTIEEPPSGPQPSAAETQAALERILHSSCFEHAGRASDFLRFVVAETLNGDGDRLKGYTIAIQVFGRPADFVGRERVIAGTDCGFGSFAGYSRVDPAVTYKKLRALAEGAALATDRLWRNNR